MSGGVFRYSNPPLILWGVRSLDKLAEELDELGVSRPYLVTTKSVAGIARSRCGVSGRSSVDTGA